MTLKELHDELGVQLERGVDPSTAVRIRQDSAPTRGSEIDLGLVTINCECGKQTMTRDVIVLRSPTAIES